MATVFEERSTYDPASDPVATLTLTVECNPGEVQNLSNFLVSVAGKGGVYSVAMDHVVAEPAPSSTAPSEVVTGETHGEQALQPKHLDAQPAELGAGGEASVRDEPAEQPADADSVVAWTAGEVGTGSVGGGS